MNEELHQHLLASRRPGDESTDDQIVAALRKLKDDPVALAAAEADLHLDESIRAALHREIMVPEGLMHQLHALAPAPRTVLQFPRRSVLGWMGGAAAALATGVYFLTRRPLDFDHWKSTAIAWVRDPKLDKMDAQLSVLKTHLAGRGALVPSQFPARLAGFPTIGCQCLHVDGQPVSVVCFLHKEQPYHTFVARADKVGAAADWFSPNAPRIWSEAEGWNFATWQAGDQDFMLLTQAPEKELRALFATA